MSKYRESYLAIIDIGTGSIRLTIFDSTGHVQEVRQVENLCLYPEPGYVEQDPGAWWSDLAEMFMDLPETTRNQITVISVTGQREGIVPVNDQFEPGSNLITWLDSRTTKQADYILKELGEEFIYSETGLVHNPAWSLSKILWIKENQPQVYEASFKLLQAVDYIQSRLSGKACTDVSMASRTCMLNVAQRTWSEEILNRFGIAINKLPDLLEPGEEIGEISSMSADQFGLQKNVKILAGAGDQQAAAIGVGAFNEGIVSIGIGTSSALSITIAQPIHIKEGSIILNCAAVPGKWEYEPPIWNTGSLIKWFHDQIDETSSSYEELLEQAEKVAPGSNGLLAIPYFSGAGSPRWDTGLAGGFYGLNLTHKRIHLLRALMEAIAFEICYNIELIEKSGVDVHRLILSGGASQNTLLCQIIADVLQKPVQVFSETEASTWGLYVLVRSKIEKNLPLESLHSSLNLEFKDIKPDPGKEDTYSRHYSSYLKLGDALSQVKF